MDSIARQQLEKLRRQKAKASRGHGGIATDRFVVELRGRQYFIVDSRTGMGYGGPYPNREVAQQRADAINVNMWHQ